MKRQTPRWLLSLPQFALSAWAVGWTALQASIGFTAEDKSVLPPAIRRLAPLHTPLGKPASGDWLDQHKESGQTYKQYVSSKPIRATPARRAISIQPLGRFSDTERKIIGIAAKFEGIFFQLPVEVREDMSLAAIPEKAQRAAPDTGDPQILSTYVLDELLKPALPPNAAVSIAFTGSDLWPGEGWNFVFGQASIGDRVGVWSIHRFGDPSESQNAFRVTLRRTLRTAVHETGHMFSMQHCIYYQCVMNGSNHLDEADRLPLSLCPTCLAKLCHATSAEPQRRFRELVAFAKEHGLESEESFWRQSLEAMHSSGARP